MKKGNFDFLVPADCGDCAFCFLPKKGNRNCDGIGDNERDRAAVS